MMAGSPALVINVLLLAVLCNAAFAVATLHPLSEAEKVAERYEGSLEETYQAVSEQQALNSDLDLPDAPEGAAKIPAVAVDATKRFGPKAEIAHVFRQPEKRPPAQLSNAFFVLTLLPLVGFVVGLRYVGANIKNLPTSGLPLLSALGFHGGIGAILTLYFFFWLKLNLFITLKVLGFLGVFTCITGYLTLSHVAEESSKVKTA